MRLHLIAVVFLAAAVFVGSGKTALASEAYTSEEHGFRIVFPVSPEVNESEFAATSGPARMIRLRAKKDSLRTSITVVAFDREPFTPAEAAYGLDKSRDRQVAQVQGRIVSQEELELDGHPGREVVIAFGPPEQDFRYRVRTYYIGSRQFLLSVIGLSSDVASAGAEAYFTSFGLTE